MSQYKVAVIGAGFGGIALAIRLQSAGIQTVIFEARDKPGGRAYVYEEQGFVFDAGPTVVTDPDCLDELFAITNKKMSDYIEMTPIEPFYRLYWEDGYTFDYSNNLALIKDQIKAKNPTDVAGYERMLAYSRKVMNEGYIKLGTEAFLSVFSMLKVAPQLLKLQSFRSVYSMVSSFIKDDQLRQAFTFNSLLIGGNPFKSSSIYLLIHALEHQWGVHFPKGGTHKLIQALVKLFEELGGKIKLNSPVVEITTDDNQVTGVLSTDGFTHKFDAVASNADVFFTYDQLLKSTARGRQMAKRLRRKTYSPSLFVVYFGVEGSWPDLKHHSIFFGPRYRELLKMIFKGPSLPENFSLYLHAPTVSDPSMAPPGCSTFYALSPVPHLGNAPIDWAETGPKYRDQIIDYLDQRYMPGLKDKIVTTRIFTPEDFKTELNAHLGSAFSLAPTLIQSAWFRTHNRDKKIKGLYFVGAGTHPGAGIPGVVGSAKATAKLMLADHQTAWPATRMLNKLEKKPLKV